MLLWQGCWAGESYFNLFCNILDTGSVTSWNLACWYGYDGVLVLLRVEEDMVSKKVTFRKGFFFSYRHQRAFLIVLFLLGLLCHSWQAVCSSPTTKHFFKQHRSTNVTPLSHTRTPAHTPTLASPLVCIPCCMTSPHGALTPWLDWVAAAELLIRSKDHKLVPRGDINMCGGATMTQKQHRIYTHAQTHTCSS